MPASSSMPWNRRFTIVGRPLGAARGATSKLSNTRPSNGSTGSIIAACWSPSATSRLPKPKINMMLPQTNSIWQPDSQPKASGKPGAVQTGMSGSIRAHCSSEDQTKSATLRGSSLETREASLADL